ncbi:MAG: response regulator transcription factor [Bryobacterales bacterium]|nr:response regulator transcription factor [Bryobacterales bacterium]
MAHLLLIEDEVGIQVTIEDRLRSEGYSVESVADGRAGLERASGGGIDLIVLDRMLPSLGGLQICKELRSAGIATPVLMLTAKGQLTDRVSGLRAGADDYLVKPFQMEELVARIEALLRRDRMRATAHSPPEYRFGEIRISPKEASVFRSGQRLQLSAKEYQLLLYLVQNPRRVLSRKELLREVWQYRAEISTRTVDVHVGWLRQKVELDPRRPRWIVTRHGIGYIFDPTESGG